MLTPLYTILPITILVTVAAPGAAAAATVVPVEALSGDVPSGTMLRFDAGKVAVMADDAAAGDISIIVEPLAFDLVAADEAGYAPPNGNALLSERWAKLASDAERTAQHIRAEMALGLSPAPAGVYTGTDAEQLSYAVVLQINFQLARGETPDVMKTTANAKTGLNETYRDRAVDPEAAAIVQRVTGATPVRFAPTFSGV